MRDFAQFDTALRTGVIVRTDTLSAAWRAPGAYPHGIGWFVQSYNGENVVWQFGAGGSAATGSSSMSITIPSKGVTLILVANSGGLAKGFSLNTGDLTLSPFARCFWACISRKDRPMRRFVLCAALAAGLACARARGMADSTFIG